MKTIKLKIDKYGNTRVQTEGFSGSECLEASQRLEVSLGKKLADDPTQEMYDGSCGVDLSSGNQGGGRH